MTGQVRAGRRRSGSRRAGFLAAGLVGALVAAVLSAPTTALAADVTLPSVAVPLHDAPTLDLVLGGASQDAVLVGRNDEFRFTGVDRFAGPLGAGGTGPATLTPSNVLRRSATYNNTWPLALIGRTFGWVSEIPRTPTSPYRFFLHRTNLLTGADVEAEVPLQPIAYTGDAWLAWSGSDLVRTTFDGVRTTVLAGAKFPAGVVADDTGALVSSLGPDVGVGLRNYRLDLITFGSGTAPATVERVVDSLKTVDSIGLSASTLAWVAGDQTGARATTVNQRARAGGVVSSGPGPRVPSNQITLAVGDGRVGYLDPATSGTRLHIVTGGSATPSSTVIPLPAGGNGLAVVGDRFVTAVSGPVALAGVYSIDGTAVTRVATVPTPKVGVISLAFSGSRLYYADPSSPTAAGMAVWGRKVSGTGTPLLSPEKLFPRRAVRVPDVAHRSMTLSAGRGAVLLDDPRVFRWQFLDRGTATGTAVQAHLPESDPDGVVNGIYANVSGPFAVAQGKVYRPDGSLLFTRPGSPSIQAARDDLFGNRLIYSLADYTAGQNTIWVHDVLKPRSSTNPRKLARYTRPTGPRRVTIWGDTVAWMRTSRIIRIQNLSTGKVREVTTAGAIHELVLGEGTLAWQAVDDTISVLDLASATSKPVSLKGKSTTVTLDDHRIARRTDDDGQVVVSRLPFAATYRPRLIGTLARAGFTPNGDHRADVWSPKFDTGKPLTGVTLRIKGPQGGRTLRKLTGTGPDGSIRDLVWDGRDASGALLPVGSYRWELSAQAADGDGALIPAHTGATLIGTVTVVRPRKR